MESDIIVQGFREAESKYGLRYTKFVGDGDSSVYPNLITGVPQWGHAIHKIECAKHAIKCYRGALEKLAQENVNYRGKGKLTSNMRKRLTKAARCAIKMRSTMSDRKLAANLLCTDLHNGPLHCFGVHDKCSTDYCQVAKNDTFNPDASTDTSPTHLSPTSSTGLVANTVSQEIQHWQDALDESNIEAIRHDTISAPTDLDPAMMWDIQRLVGRLIVKADQLLGNEDYR